MNVPLQVSIGVIAKTLVSCICYLHSLLGSMQIICKPSIRSYKLKDRVLITYII